MEQYLPIAVLLVLAVLFAGLSFFASGLVSPRRPTAAKSAPYECGIVPSREPAQRFPVRFYLVAMIFIVFDIEIIFLYPWAVIFQDLGSFGLIEMIVFVIVTFAAFVYLIANGALDWGPPRPSLSGAADRSSTSTIRRVSSSEMHGSGDAYHSHTTQQPSDAPDQTSGTDQTV